MINERMMQEFSNSLMEVHAAMNDRIAMPILDAIGRETTIETYDMMYDKTANLVIIGVDGITNTTLGALDEAFNSATFHEGAV